MEQYKGENKESLSNKVEEIEHILSKDINKEVIITYNPKDDIPFYGLSVLAKDLDGHDYPFLETWYPETNIKNLVNDIYTAYMDQFPLERKFESTYLGYNYPNYEFAKYKPTLIKNEEETNKFTLKDFLAGMKENFKSR